MGVRGPVIFTLDMVERFSLKFSAQFALGVAAILALPAAWSFLSAVYSAFATGEVLVISVGRTETARQLVPWKQGWARFVAPPLLVASLFVWGISARRPLLWWGAVAGCVVAIVLLLFSLWFVSTRSVLAFFAFLSFIVAAMLLGNFVGRLAAFAFVLAAAALFLWSVTHHV